MITLNKTLRLFLDSIGRRDEYEFYLGKFHGEHTACFALLCPDEGSVETATEVLAFDLHFLMRLELIPAILLCGEKAMALQNVLEQEKIFRFKTFMSGVTAEAVVPFIQQSQKAEQVPVLVLPDVALADALLALLPGITRRVHFIRAGGGLKSSTGEQLDYVYTHKDNGIALEPLEFDYPEIGKRLQDIRPGVHLSITSPINLLEEIFTVKGAGTVFRKGSRIESFRSRQEIDEPRLIDLLEKSFGKKLRDTGFLDEVDAFYIEENYRGAVLLETQVGGLYLSKFAVGKEARGEGLAMELWREVCRNHAAFYWRSARANPFNSWYDQQADGRHAAGKWQIFWRGVPAHSISEIIDYCTDRTEDFVY